MFAFEHSCSSFRLGLVCWRVRDYACACNTPCMCNLPRTSSSCSTRGNPPIPQSSLLQSVQHCAVLPPSQLLLKEETKEIAAVLVWGAGAWLAVFRAWQPSRYLRRLVGVGGPAWKFYSEVRFPCLSLLFALVGCASFFPSSFASTKALDVVSVLFDGL